jgi:hypothetical protein
MSKLSFWAHTIETKETKRNNKKNKETLKKRIKTFVRVNKGMDYDTIDWPLYAELKAKLATVKLNKDYKNALNTILGNIFHELYEGEQFFVEIIISPNETFNVKLLDVTDDSIHVSGKHLRKERQIFFSDIITIIKCSTED